MKRILLLLIPSLLFSSLCAYADTQSKATESHRPKLFAVLPDGMQCPDGLTVSDTTGTIFMTVTNFNGLENNNWQQKKPSCLVKVGMDGSIEKLLEFPAFHETGQTASMGLDMGPDGHLYVADNQFWFNQDHKSRVLRVVMDGDKPTGKVEVVAEGLKLANALLWTNDKMYVTDTNLQLKDKFGAGGIWTFSKDEALKAGSDDTPSIKVKPNGSDPRLIVIQETKKVGRGDNSGWDGLTEGPDGTLYGGNYGNGALFAVRFSKDGKPDVEEIHKGGEVFESCDGVFYDKRSNRVYVNDPIANAIRAFKPTNRGEKAQLELIWQNGDTDGADGSLDQPIECVVIGSKMIIVNFGWPFPGTVNTTFDQPATLSVIDLGAKTDP